MPHDPTPHNYIAVDLGAGSGRVMLGRLASGELKLEEHRRFENMPVEVGGHLRWDVLSLWANVQKGIELATAAAGGKVESVSTDSWGVDYVLQGLGSPMLQPPIIYRDPRTDTTFPAALAEAGEGEIFGQTGIQFMPINTLYQLLAEPPALLAAAERMLPLGDYFNQLLGGRPVTDVSMASTTQCFDVRRRTWATPLLERLGLRPSLFPEVVETGTVTGERPDGIKVIQTCTHDTGCAVAAVPADPQASWAYLSSGTWSLLGVEADGPVVTDRCRELNFTNELGYGGKTRLLKNLSGLFILQECRRDWQRDHRDMGWHKLAKMAEDAPPLASLIRPEHPRFGQPTDMPHEIAGYLRATGQPTPEPIGGYVRCIYESLALLYRKSLAELEELVGRKIEVLHVVGGGGQARLLNQLTADATGLPVKVGPYEATAMGNLLIQSATLGHIDPADIRPIVRRSQSVETFEPDSANARRMSEAFERFTALPTDG